MSNQSDTYAFFKSYALFTRLLDEFIDLFEIVKKEEDQQEGNTKTYVNRRRDDNVHIKIEVETLNLVLDSWRVINNT